MHTSHYTTQRQLSWYLSWSALPAGDVLQPNGIASPDTQQEASTVATPAGKEASSVDPSLGTPASALCGDSGSSPTPDNPSPAAGAQQGGTSSSAADADAVSVKQLIQRRSSSSTVSIALLYSVTGNTIHL